jgi:hypothetical protein
MRRSSVFLAVLVAGSLAAKAEPDYVGTVQIPALADTQTTPAPGSFSDAPVATVDQDVTPAPTHDVVNQAPPETGAEVALAPEVVDQASPAPKVDDQPAPAVDAAAATVATGSEDGTALAGGFLAAVFMIAGFAFLLCLIPTLIAFKRRHRDRKAILVLSIFFGWLPFAWVIGLIWALTGNVELLNANA